MNISHWKDYIAFEFYDIKGSLLIGPVVEGKNIVEADVYF